MSADFWRGRTALVTGTAGFIGSQLSEKLIALGASVVGLDCLTDYYPQSIKRLNLRSLVSSKAFEFLECDLNSADLGPIVNRADVIFHLAAQPGVRASWGDGFATYLERNLAATQRLLEALKPAPRRLVFASSSSVYGDALTLPTSEETERRPVSPYGMTKSACEDLLRIYTDNHGVPSVMLRYFTVFGPRQRPDMAFHRLLAAAAEGRPFTVYGDGSQERDITYVGDVVDATIAAGEKDVPAGERINIGGGRMLSLKEIIAFVETFAHPDFRVDYAPFEAGDARATGASIDKARRLLGYDPRTDWKEGLKRQLDVIKERSR